MKVFVTGGSGFVGGHVIEALRAAGHEAYAMARSDRSAAAVEALGATPVRCELGEMRPKHLDGMDAVVHAAAFVEPWGTREQFWRTNVEGTRQLLETAKRADCPRFIFIGTEAALFDGHDLDNVDEQTPYPERHRYIYSETKAAAEQLVLVAATDTFAAISLRPCLIWGPRDATILPELVEMTQKGAFMWLDGGRHEASTTHVHNLVHAIMLALEHGRSGEAYFVADRERTDLRTFLTDLAATADLELPNLSVPGWLGRALAAATETTWRTLGLKSNPPMTSFAMAMLSRDHTVNTEKAARELGYEAQISVADGLAQLAA